jgi:hypothetical protein
MRLYRPTPIAEREHVPIPADVITAVIGAYYPRALAATDAAHSRAQAAYSIASAIAAALVAAGVFGGLSQKLLVTQILGVAALVGWLIAAGLYLIAVSAPFQGTPAQQQTPEAFVKAVLVEASSERQEIDRWQSGARVAAAIAATLTVAAFAFAVFDAPGDNIEGIVTLTAEGRAVVATACTTEPKPIMGVISTDDLEKKFVTVTLLKPCKKMASRLCSRNLSCSLSQRQSKRTSRTIGVWRRVAAVSSCREMLRSSVLALTEMDAKLVTLSSECWPAWETQVAPAQPPQN